MPVAQPNAGTRCGGGQGRAVERPAGTRTHPAPARGLLTPTPRPGAARARRRRRRRHVALHPPTTTLVPPLRGHSGLRAHRKTLGDFPSGRGRAGRAGKGRVRRCLPRAPTGSSWLGRRRCGSLCGCGSSTANACKKPTGTFSTFQIKSPQGQTLISFRLRFWSRISDFYLIILKGKFSLGNWRFASFRSKDFLSVIAIK